MFAALAVAVDITGASKKMRRQIRFSAFIFWLEFDSGVQHETRLRCPWDFPFSSCDSAAALQRNASSSLAKPDLAPADDSEPEGAAHDTSSLEPWRSTAGWRSRVHRHAGQFVIALGITYRGLQRKLHRSLFPAGQIKQRDGHVIVAGFEVGRQVRLVAWRFE